MVDTLETTTGGSGRAQAAPQTVQPGTTVHGSRGPLLRAFTEAGWGGAAVVDLLTATDAQWDAVAEAIRRLAEERAETILLSAQGAAAPDGPFLQTMLERERAAREALPWATTLRLAPLIEDLGVYAERVVAAPVVHHGYSAGPVAWIRAEDVPKAAAAARRQSTAEDAPAVFEFSGSHTATVEQVLTVWAEVAGTTVELIPLPAEVFVEHLSGLGGPDFAAAVAAHNAWVGSHATGETTPPEVVAWLTGGDPGRPETWPAR